MGKALARSAESWTGAYRRQSEDADAVARAVCDAFETVRRYVSALDGTPRAAVQLAVALEDAANRLLDLGEDLNEAHLAAYLATLPADLPDDTDYDAVTR